MNLFGLISSTVGLGASLLGNNSTQKKMMQMQQRQLQLAENNLARQQAMWQPYVNAGLNSLRQTQAFTNEQYAERYSGDRLADIARDRSLANVAQTTARNNANIVANFGNNTGRIVGSQMRNNRAGNEAVTNANFNWAQQVRSKQTQATNNYLQGLTQLNQAGYTGTNAMSQAYNNYTQMASQANAMAAGNTNSAWQDIGGMLFGIGADSLLQNYGKQTAVADQGANPYAGLQASNWNGAPGTINPFGIGYMTADLKPVPGHDFDKFKYDFQSRYGG